MVTRNDKIPTLALQTYHHMKVEQTTKELGGCERNIDSSCLLTTMYLKTHLKQTAQLEQKRSGGQ